MRREMKQQSLNLEKGLNIIMWFYVRTPLVTNKINLNKTKLIELIFQDHSRLEVCLDVSYTNISLNIRGNKVEHSINIKQWYMME